LRSCQMVMGGAGGRRDEGLLFGISELQGFPSGLKSWILTRPGTRKSLE
jgi:hypothetical protein